MSDLILRPFVWGDIPAITAIYAHYVKTSTATFDLEAPGPTSMAEKFGHMVEAGHPVVIAERQGELIGYGYASTYRPRPAYRFTCEDSVYVRADVTGQGLGRVLLAELIDQSQAQGFKQMIAVITAESLGSIALHEKFGFRHIGRHEALGLKFDKWLDVVHMQRAL